MSNDTNTPREKRKFTVLVLKPDYIANAFGQDTFLAYVEAYEVAAAQELAQLQASNADCNTDAEREDANPEDYHILSVFEGHHTDIKED